MGIQYSSAVFYGVVLAVSHDDFYENGVDDNFDYSGKVSIDSFGDRMDGTDVLAAYYKPLYKKGGQDGDFGLFSMNELGPEEEADKALAEALVDIPVVGKPGWLYANNVS